MSDEPEHLRATRRVADEAFYRMMQQAVELTEAEEVRRLQGPRVPTLARVRADMLEAQGGRCPICKKAMTVFGADVDHIVPYSRGGGSERANLQLAHASCNRSKGNEVDVRVLADYLVRRYG